MWQAFKRGGLKPHMKRSSVANQGPVAMLQMQLFLPSLTSVAANVIIVASCIKSDTPCQCETAT